jgi:hypothetical protein
MKKAGSGAGSGPNTDPLVRCGDPQIRIRNSIKISLYETLPKTYRTYGS